MTWKCVSCGFENIDKQGNCEICYKYKESINYTIPKTTDIRTSPHWTCTKCHTGNQPNDYICRCNKKAPFYGKWCCEICNVFNDPFSLECVACNHKNNHLEVCEKCHMIMVNLIYNKLCDKCKNPQKLCESCNRNKVGNDGKRCNVCQYDLPNNRNELKSPVMNVQRRSNFHSLDRKNNNNRNDFKRNNNEKLQSNLEPPMMLCEKCHEPTANVKVRFCDNCVWRCRNNYCKQVNNRPSVEYCYTCGLQKDTDPKPCGKAIWVRRFDKAEQQPKVRQYWQCNYCGAFVFEKVNNCYKCKCPRNDSIKKKICPCKWVNFKRNECLKCSMQL